MKNKIRNNIDYRVEDLIKNQVFKQARHQVERHVRIEVFFETNQVYDQVRFKVVNQIGDLIELSLRMMI